MQLASTTAFHDFAPFIFSDHTLHLQEKLRLGTVANFMIEKNQLYPTTMQLINDQHLIGVVPGKSVRTKDIQLINGAQSSHVTKSFQGRTDKRGPTVTIVDEAQRLI